MVRSHVDVSYGSVMQKACFRNYILYLKHIVYAFIGLWKTCVCNALDVHHASLVCRCVLRANHGFQSSYSTQYAHICICVCCVLLLCLNVMWQSSPDITQFTALCARWCADTCTCVLYKMCYNNNDDTVVHTSLCLCCCSQVHHIHPHACTLVVCVVHVCMLPSHLYFNILYQHIVDVCTYRHIPCVCWCC